MNLTLLRHDPTLRTALRVAPLAAVVCWPAAAFMSDDRGLLLFVLVVPPLLALSSVPLLRRASEHHLALPISGPELAATRILALLAHVLLPAASVLAVFFLSRPAGAGGSTAIQLVSVACALPLPLLLVDGVAPGRNAVPAGPGLVVASVAGVLAVVAAVLFPGPGLAATLVAAWSLVAVRTYRKAPPALELATEATPPQSRPALGWRSRAGLLGMVLPRLAWGQALILAVWVLFLVGTDTAGMAVWLGLLLPGLVSHLLLADLRAIAWTDPLPVTRRWQLACVLGPGLLVMATLGVGIALQGAPPRPVPLVRYEHQCLRTFDQHMDPCHYRVVVPEEHWRVAVGWEPPPLTAPWGEVVHPPPHRFFWGLPVALYEPHAVGEDSSLRFIAWQMSRAVRDVYGYHIAPEEMAERYLREDAWNQVEMVGDGFTLLEDYPLRSPRPANAGASVALLVVLGWFATVALSLRRAHARPRSSGILGSWAWAAALVVVALYVLVAPGVGAWGLAAALIAAQAVLPADPTAAPAAVVAALVVAFLLLARLFRRFEIAPPDPVDPPSRLPFPPLLRAAFVAAMLLSFPLLMGIHTLASTGSLRELHVALLLGADVNAIDSDGETALHWAAYSGHSGVVRLLLEHGADPNTPGDGGRTPLHLAAWDDDSADRIGTVDALLDHGADPDARDAHGDPLLVHFVREQRVRALKRLVERGADVSVRDADGRTLFELACANGWTDAARALGELEARKSQPPDSE